MNEITLHAFSDELEKISGLKDVFRGIADIFRGEKAKSTRRVEYHFSPKAGKEKWDKFAKHVTSKPFLDMLKKHPEADKKLILHAESLHNLAKGKTLGKVTSSVGKGKRYEIVQLPGRLGCTCNDWKFKGSVTPGYDCKHIKAFKEGKTQV